MAEFDGSLKYHVFKDTDAFDEKGTTVGAFRLAQWVKEGNEPDIEKAKWEIRRLYINSEGERPGKGFTFSTPEGPHELTKIMVDNGFGNTKELLRSIRKRDDFLDAAKTINEDDEDNDEDGEMFDMRDLLLGMEQDDEDLEEVG